MKNLIRDRQEKSIELFLDKASVKYKDGWQLVFRKGYNYEMLFLEWLTQFDAAKCPLFTIRGDSKYNVFRIRLDGTKELYKQAAKYINDNSPE